MTREKLEEYLSEVLNVKYYNEEELQKIYDIHRRDVFHDDFHLRDFPELSGYAPRYNGKRKHFLLHDETHLHRRYLYKRSAECARFRRNGDRFCGHRLQVPPQAQVASCGGDSPRRAHMRVDGFRKATFHT